MMTTKKIGTGEFEVLWNGQPTRFSIVNGSRGLSGRDTFNMYGIVTAGKETPKWIGTLHNAKKIVADWLKKTNG